MFQPQGNGKFQADARELRIIDGALARLRDNEQAWRTLVVDRGLEDTYRSLKERIRRSIEADTASPH